MKEKIRDNHKRYMVSLFYVSHDEQNGKMENVNVFAHSSTEALLNAISKYKDHQHNIDIGLPLVSSDVFKLKLVKKYRTRQTML